MKNSQNGFVAAVAIILVAISIAAGATYYYFIGSRPSSAVPVSVEQQQSVKATISEVTVTGEAIYGDLSIRWKSANTDKVDIYLFHAEENRRVRTIATSTENKEVYEYSIEDIAAWRDHDGPFKVVVVSSADSSVRAESAPIVIGGSCAPGVCDEPISTDVTRSDTLAKEIKNGSQVIRITDVPPMLVSENAVFELGEGGFSDVVFSPDKSKVAFSTQNGHGFGWVYDLNSYEFIPLVFQYGGEVNIIKWDNNDQVVVETVSPKPATSQKTFKLKTLPEYPMVLKWWVVSDSETDGASVPLTQLMVEIKGTSNIIGNVAESCVVKNVPNPAANQLPTMVSCWWAGAGSDYALFRDGKNFVLKQREISEGTAEGGGVIGEYKTLFIIK